MDKPFTLGDIIAIGIAWLLVGMLMSVPAGYAAWAVMHAVAWACVTMGISEQIDPYLILGSGFGTYGMLMVAMVRGVDG